MERDVIKLQFPVLDHTESVANIGIEVTKVNPDKGIKVKDAIACVNYSHYVTIINFGKQSEMTVKAGDCYPNSMLGDIVIQIPNGISCIQLHDLMRFERTDGSIDLDFSDDFDGSVYAIGRMR